MGLVAFDPSLKVLNITGILTQMAIPHSDTSSDIAIKMTYVGMMPRNSEEIVSQIVKSKAAVRVLYEKI